MASPISTQRSTALGKSGKISVADRNQTNNSYLLGLCDAPKLGDLNVDDICGPVTPDLHQAVQVSHVLIQDEGKVCVAADDQALLEVGARLLQVHIQVGHGLGHPQGFVRLPP